MRRKAIGIALLAVVSALLLGQSSLWLASKIQYDNAASGLAAITTQAAIDEIEARTFYIVKHGAVCDGDTDDTAAIVAAITAAGAVDRGVVKVPAAICEFTELVFPDDGTRLSGVSEITSILRSTSTTGTAITFTGRVGGISDLQITSSAERSAIDATTYSDGTPDAGKHGVAFINATPSTSQGRMFLKRMVISGHPDDGVYAARPELHTYDTVFSQSNGRYGFHLNGIEDTGGTSNLLRNCRAITNGDRGWLVRAVNNTTLVHPQSLQNDGAEAIYVWGGQRIKLIQPDVEDVLDNAGTGIRLSGNNHSINGGSVIAYETPIALDGCTGCFVEFPHVTNAGFTAADEVVNLSGASDDNVLLLGSLARHNNVTKLFTNNSTNQGNVVFDGRWRHVAIKDFADADATPDVSDVVGAAIFRTANTGATTITDFDGEQPGQEITVLINDDNTTIAFSGSNLNGNGDVDWIAVQNDSMRCTNDFVSGSPGEWWCVISTPTNPKHSNCKTIETPISNEDWVSIWRAPAAVTITGMWCEAASATSVAAMLHVDISGQSAIVDDNPVDTAGDMSCTTGGATEAAPDGDVTLAAGETLDLDSNAVSGDVSAYTFCWDYIYD